MGRLARHWPWHGQYAIRARGRPLFDLHRTCRGPFSPKMLIIWLGPRAAQISAVKRQGISFAKKVNPPRTILLSCGACILVNNLCCWQHEENAVKLQPLVPRFLHCPSRRYCNGLIMDPRFDKLSNEPDCSPLSRIC